MSQRGRGGGMGGRGGRDAMGGPRFDVSPLASPTASRVVSPSTSRPGTPSASRPATPSVRGGPTRASPSPRPPATPAPTRDGAQRGISTLQRQSPLPRNNPRPQSAYENVFAASSTAQWTPHPSAPKPTCKPAGIAPPSAPAPPQGGAAPPCGVGRGGPSQQTGGSFGKLVLPRGSNRPVAQPSNPANAPQPKPNPRMHSSGRRSPTYANRLDAVACQMLGSFQTPATSNQPTAQPAAHGGHYPPPAAPTGFGGDAPVTPQQYFAPTQTGPGEHAGVHPIQTQNYPQNQTPATQALPSIRNQLPGHFDAPTPDNNLFDGSTNHWDIHTWWAALVANGRASENFQGEAYPYSHETEQSYRARMLTIGQGENTTRRNWAYEVQRRQNTRLTRCAGFQYNQMQH